MVPGRAQAPPRTALRFLFILMFLQLTYSIIVVSGVVIRHLHTSRSGRGHQDRRLRAEAGPLIPTRAAGSPRGPESRVRVSSPKSLRRSCALADSTGSPAGPPVPSHGPAVRPRATASPPGLRLLGWTPGGGASFIRRGEGQGRQGVWGTRKTTGARDRERLSGLLTNTGRYLQHPRCFSPCLNITNFNFVQLCLHRPSPSRSPVTG